MTIKVCGGYTKQNFNFLDLDIKNRPSQIKQKSGRAIAKVTVGGGNMIFTLTMVDMESVLN